jgi:hypothetical protein
MAASPPAVGFVGAETPRDEAICAALAPGEARLGPPDRAALAALVDRCGLLMVSGPSTEVALEEALARGAPAVLFDPDPLVVRRVLNRFERTGAALTVGADALGGLIDLGLVWLAAGLERLEAATALVRWGAPRRALAFERGWTWESGLLTPRRLGGPVEPVPGGGRELSVWTPSTAPLVTPRDLPLQRLDVRAALPAPLARAVSLSPGLARSAAARLPERGGISLALAVRGHAGGLVERRAALAVEDAPRAVAALLGALAARAPAAPPGVRSPARCLPPSEGLEVMGARVEGPAEEAVVLKPR